MARHPIHILVLNAGSSSLKFKLFRYSQSLECIHKGAFERIGSADGFLTHVACIPRLISEVKDRTDVETFNAIGHRVVHGGPHYHRPQLVDDKMMAELRSLHAFDPEHLPAETALMDDFHTNYPGVPQVACFDTDFHHGIPRVAKILPIPRRYESQGVQRYGFHGLSYAYQLQELERLPDASLAKGRIIMAHLGNGVSMAAVKNRHCIDTTMAFTPASGLVMGTRSGDIDPGLVLFLARRENMSAEQFDHMMNHESGLRGISETRSDMRELLALEANDIRAAEAVNLFCYRIKKQIGSYAAALGGLDTVVFAGGMGENSPQVRERICSGLEFLGIEIEAARNTAGADVISTAASRVTVRVIRTNEERMIAEAACHLLGFA